ncbi:hypothetical protein [Pseudomonas laurylsulfatiphila]|uniref:hypothetical protein n=1 Tax=Pseudomonas laurylsulfatiphila TaxID=2011015 RepID=UPI003D1F8DB4
MAKPDINMADVHWAEHHVWFSSAHYMPSTGTYKIVVKDAASTMGIRYFENDDELQCWVNAYVQLAD